MFFAPAPRMVDAARALPGRPEPIVGACPHEVFGIDVLATPPGSHEAWFALGCFWGAEKLFWQTPGVTNTAVGYAGGYTPNPTYQEVCTGLTGHTETVRVCFDPAQVSYADLVRVFFEAHDPTQGFRQGNDVGTQYRSALFVKDADQRATASDLAGLYAGRLQDAGFGPVTTDIVDADAFYPAEAYHQQYLIKNPGGYCPIHSTGVACA